MGNVHINFGFSTPFVFELRSHKDRVATVLGENNSRTFQGLSKTFKYLFQTYSSDVLPRDVRVLNVFGIR